MITYYTVTEAGASPNPGPGGFGDKKWPAIYHWWRT